MCVFVSVCVYMKCVCVCVSMCKHTCRSHGLSFPGSYARLGDDSQSRRLAVEQESPQPPPPPSVLVVRLSRHQGHHMANLGHDEGHHYGPRQVGVANSY